MFNLDPYGECLPPVKNLALINLGLMDANGKFNIPCILEMAHKLIAQPLLPTPAPPSSGSNGSFSHGSGSAQHHSDNQARLVTNPLSSTRPVHSANTTDLPVRARTDATTTTSTGTTTAAAASGSSSSIYNGTNSFANSFSKLVTTNLSLDISTSSSNTNNTVPGAKDSDVSTGDSDMKDEVNPFEELVDFV